MWCPIQKLGSFDVDWYSAGIHNFVVFVHFSKLTHKCALFVKEWKESVWSSMRCLTTSSSYSQTLMKYVNVVQETISSFLSQVEYEKRSKIPRQVVHTATSIWSMLLCGSMKKKSWDPMLWVCVHFIKVACIITKKQLSTLLSHLETCISSKFSTDISYNSPTTPIFACQVPGDNWKYAGRQNEWIFVMQHGDRSQFGVDGR